MTRDQKNLAQGNADRQQLVQALVATGGEDRVAFGRVYLLTSRKLFGICLRICGNRQVAEDVLQEVYLTIWRRAGSFDPGRASPITWLATIARNRAIDARRSRGLPPPERDDPAVTAVADPAPLADERLGAEQADRTLHDCLGGLDDDKRDAIRAAFFGGLTYAELADREKIPLGTMKSRIRRGLAQLRECLGDD